MKSINNFFAIITLLAFSVPTESFAQSKKDMDEIEVRVNGLGCPFCAYGLEKKMKELKGVKGLKIDMKKGVMTLKYPSEKQITAGAIEDQVTVAGYTAVYTNLTRWNGEFFTTKREEVNTDEMTNLSESSFMVYGKCAMCKARIEKIADSMEGIYDADWDVKSQILTVKIDNDVATLEELHDAIAKAGHDTERLRASDEVYENLPACCLYERKVQ